MSDEKKESKKGQKIKNDMNYIFQFPDSYSEKDREEFYNGLNEARENKDDVVVAPEVNIIPMGSEQTQAQKEKPKEKKKEKKSEEDKPKKETKKKKEPEKKEKTENKENNTEEE